MNGKLLTIDEVAAFLDVHRDTVYNLIRSGRLAAIQLGGRKAGWRISEEDLQAYIEEARARTAGQLLGARDELQAFDRLQQEELEAFQDRQQARREAFRLRRSERPRSEDRSA